MSRIRIPSASALLLPTTILMKSYDYNFLSTPFQY